jgi:hypothetical protein
MKPISLRIRNAKILADAHAALARAGRDEEVRQAHNTRVMKRAREIVARRQERDRLQRCARLAAHKAILLAKDAFAKITASVSNDIDRERWREQQKMVEAALMEIVEKR